MELTVDGKLLHYLFCFLFQWLTLVRHVGHLDRLSSRSIRQHDRLAHSRAQLRIDPASTASLPFMDERPANSAAGKERILELPEGFLVGRRKRLLPGRRRGKGRGPLAFCLGWPAAQCRRLQSVQRNG